MHLQFLSTTVALVLSSFLSAFAQNRLLGGDISLLPSYEQQGTVYRDSAGKVVVPLDFFKNEGWNAMRIRLFVDPNKAPSEHKDEGVCQDLEYVKKLGRRIKDAGYRLMLDFHYSDTWADPAKQFTPQRWKDTPKEALADSIYQYTKNSLTAMTKAGAKPDLIQVGNEISYGMLWPSAKVDPLKEDGWDFFASLINSGAKACREVCPEAKIIIHTERAGMWPVTKGFYEKLRERSVDYDIIGLSYYPMWHKSIDVLSATLDSMATTFADKEVMIVEAAAYYSHDNDHWTTDPDQYSEFFPISKVGQQMFTHGLVAELRRHANVTGLFWWFPEENAYGNNVVKSWLNRGLFDNHDGKALPALYELEKYIK